MRRLSLVLLAALCVSVPAVAQPAPVRVTYAVYFAGLNVADLQASFALTPLAYRASLAFRLTGTAGALFSGGGVSTVEGGFAGDKAVPRTLSSTGQMRGVARATQIEWHGGRPAITQLLPPVEPEREAVPVAAQDGTIDSLSAMAVLLRRVWGTGRCESEVRTFDGRWLSQIQSRTVGEEVLEATSRSPFHGVALRCDIEGHQLAGFFRDADPAAAHRPHRASVWFARPAPGEALVPVRIAIETRGFGEATLYLTGE